MNLYRQGRPKGNGHRCALKTTVFDGNVCQCGHLVPAEYKEVDGWTTRIANTKCEKCRTALAQPGSE